MMFDWLLGVIGISGVIGLFARGPICDSRAGAFWCLLGQYMVLALRPPQPIAGWGR